MTRDTDGTPPRLTVLEAMVARYTGWKRRRGDTEDAVPDEPDDRGEPTQTIARKVCLLATVAALLAVAGIWGLSSNFRGTPDGAAQRSVRPTAGPAAAQRHPTSGEMDSQLPDTYRVLMTRSIFAKDGAAAGKDAAAASAGKMVLKGVTQEDQRFTAYLQAAGRVLELHVGDTLATGSIRRISLHAIEYQADGRLTRVEIGQPLDAGAIVAGGSSAWESTQAWRPAPSLPNGPIRQAQDGPAAGAKPAPDHSRELPLFAGEPTR